MACMRQSFRAGVVLDGRYRSEEYIHAGSFGMVFKAEDLVTGKHVAIKCLTKRSVVDDTDAEFAIDDSEELGFHQILGHHGNIVNLITSFETESHLYLVLEYCERGDLYEAIYHNTGPVETEKVRRIMLQLIDAVEYIHSKGVYHRDIKPENIFLLNDTTVKLGDFGLSTSEEVSYENMVGSDRYMAPEQCESDGAGYSPEKADIWAIGIVLLNLLFSKNPFTKPTVEDPFFRDFCNSREALSEIFDIGKDTYDVLEHCLNLNPAKRSLERARDALLRVQSFTTSCEDEDDFLTGSARAQATVNREPLGTPAIQSPVIEQGVTDEKSFWADVVQCTPPQPIPASKLSIVQEASSYTEDLFSKSVESDWCSATTGQSHSLASTVDSNAEYIGQSSGFVLTLPERNRNDKSAANKTTGAGSLPINVTRPKPVPSLSMIFGRKNDGPRSWSDMFEEDEEEAHSEADQRANALKERNARTFSRESNSGNTTAKVEDYNAAAMAENKKSVTDTESVVDDTSDKEDACDGFFVYEPTSPDRGSTPATQSQWPRYNPPSKRSRPTTMDRWAALGERRRAYADMPRDTQAERQSPITSKSSTSNSTLGTKEFRSRRHFGFGNGNAAVGAAQGGNHSTSYYHHSNSYNFHRTRETRPGQSREVCPWTRRNDHGVFHREGDRGDCRDLNWRRDRRQPFGNCWWVGGYVEARS